MELIHKLMYLFLGLAGLSMGTHFLASLVTTNLHKHPRRLLIRDLFLLVATVSFIVAMGMLVWMSFVLPDLFGGK